MRVIRSTATCFAVATALLSAGCATYRVDSNVEGPVSPAPTSTLAPKVLISESNLPGQRYKEIGPIEVSVKKLTIFHADPTKEQANNALIERARTLGADAVINVTYQSGIGLTTWGYIDAKGLAVKLLP